MSKLELLGAPFERHIQRQLASKSGEQILAGLHLADQKAVVVTNRALYELSRTQGFVSSARVEHKDILSVRIAASGMLRVLSWRTASNGRHVRYYVGEGRYQSNITHLLEALATGTGLDSAGDDGTRFSQLAEPFCDAIDEVNLGLYPILAEGSIGPEGAIALTTDTFILAAGAQSSRTHPLATLDFIQVNSRSFQFAICLNSGEVRSANASKRHFERVVMPLLRELASNHGVAIEVDPMRTHLAMGNSPPERCLNRELKGRAPIQHQVVVSGGALLAVVEGEGVFAATHSNVHYIGPGNEAEFVIVDSGKTTTLECRAHASTTLLQFTVDASRLPAVRKWLGAHAVLTERAPAPTAPTPTLPEPTVLTSNTIDPGPTSQHPGLAVRLPRKPDFAALTVSEQDYGLACDLIDAVFDRIAVTMPLPPQFPFAHEFMHYLLSFFSQLSRVTEPERPYGITIVNRFLTQNWTPNEIIEWSEIEEAQGRLVPLDARLPVMLQHIQRSDEQNGTNYLELLSYGMAVVGQAVVISDGQVHPDEVRLLRRHLHLLAPQTWDSPDADEDRDSEKSALLELHDLIGLDSVKAQVDGLVSLVSTDMERRQHGLPAIASSHHMLFTGNPGTGKTVVARIIARCYRQLGLLRRGHVVEVDRSGLVASYMGQTATKVQEVVRSALGGVLFIDEAYALHRGSDSDRDSYGLEALDTLIKSMEDHRDDLVVIMAGYTDEMRKLVEANPGIRSRVPTVIEFPDYTDDELVAIFEQLAARNQLTPTPDALDAVRAESKYRRAQGGTHFGNGREMRNILEGALRLHSMRVQKLPERTPEDLTTLTGADIPTTRPKGLRATPADARPQDRDADEPLAQALAELDELVGLDNVKDEVRRLVALAKHTQLRVRAGLPASIGSRHLVLTGNPGTGKTTVARILGRAFGALGILYRGHVVEVDRSHLVASYVGQTAAKTTDVVKSALGGVLFIDEAYALTNGRHESDYGREALDTLVKLIEDHRENLVVMIAGYTSEMEAFLATNPGLQSRFPRRLQFPDYSCSELVEIFKRMAKKASYTLAPGTLESLEELVSRVAVNGNAASGNARFVRTLLERATEECALRVSKLTNPTPSDLMTLQPGDISHA